MPWSRWAVLGLAAATLLGAGRLAHAADPIGAARCGSCHVDAYAQWRQTAHAQSLTHLSDSQRKNPTCRACHTLAPERDDGALAGVQCESCHGDGSDYAPDHVMRDPRLARMLGLKEVDAGTCRACHEGVNARLQPYDYARMLREVAHGAGRETADAR